jgi:hypothetical protein
VLSFPSVAGRVVEATSAAAERGQPQKLLAEYLADSSVCTIIGSRFKDRVIFMMLLNRGGKMANMRFPDFYPSSCLAITFMDSFIQDHQED